jgi:arginyl-tRNA synthetase
LKRLYQFFGYNTIGDIHLGDWGLQMGLIIAELQERQPELCYFDANYTGEYPAEPPFTISELEEILPDESIASEISNEEIGKHISNFLRKEKAEIRKVFIRKYYFFDSVSEIAERYGFTESKVKNMLYHTRNKLKKYFIKEGIEI